MPDPVQSSSSLGTGPRYMAGTLFPTLSSYLFAATIMVKMVAVVGGLEYVRVPVSGHKIPWFLELEGKLTTGEA